MKLTSGEEFKRIIKKRKNIDTWFIGGLVPSAVGIFVGLMALMIIAFAESIPELVKNPGEFMTSLIGIPLWLAFFGIIPAGVIGFFPLLIGLMVYGIAIRKTSHALAIVWVPVMALFMVSMAILVLKVLVQFGATGAGNRYILIPISVGALAACWTFREFALKNRMNEN